jgi:AhpD family alkylhydroperoxidase
VELGLRRLRECRGGARRIADTILGFTRDAKKSGPRMSHSAALSRHVIRNHLSPKEMSMTPRLNPFAAAHASMQPWLEFSNEILKCGLEDSLMELVKIRASQINGCAFCLHMHTAATRKHGESEARLYLLDAWRDSPLYNERERAALAWTEALTLVSETRAPDDVYDAYFGERDRRFRERDRFDGVGRCAVLIVDFLVSFGRVRAPRRWV